MVIWKFGCNWERNTNSFYEFIHEERIVLGRTNRTPYMVGDLVLITDKFNVLAIAEVKERPKSITKIPNYGFVTNNYGIRFEEATTVAAAEWYELPPNQQFEYKCENGACGVRKADIVQTAEMLWNNRK